MLASLLIYKFSYLVIDQNHLSEGVIGTYQKHDLPESVSRLISSSLVNFDDSGRVIPNLAENWEANQELTEFSFKLKSQTWTDGTQVKSSDLEFSIPDVEVSYPDDQTVLFKLKEAFSPLPSLLTKPLFKKGTMIGTGPYTVTKMEISRIFLTRVTLVPAWDQNLPDLTIRFYPNEKIAQTALNLGEVQSLIGINDLGQAIGSSVFGLKQTVAQSKVVSILYDTKDPILGSRSLRQALSYNSPEVVGEAVAVTPIPPFSWSYTKEVNDYLSNPKAAKAAFDRAKSQVSADSLKKELVLTTTPQYAEVGKQIVDSWQKLDLKAVLRIESGIPQNFQALLIAQAVPLDPDQYALWHSTQTKTNLTGYDSKRVDKDLEDGRKTIKEEERKLKYIDFQKTLLEDSPATFLYFPKYNVIYLKKIESKLNQVLPLQLPR